MYSTMVEPIAGSSSMAIVIIAASLQQPLCDGLVKGFFEGIYHKRRGLTA
jgi:hypothetical protein